MMPLMNVKQNSVNIQKSFESLNTTVILTNNTARAGHKDQQNHKLINEYLSFTKKKHFINQAGFLFFRME